MVAEERMQVAGAEEGTARDPGLTALFEPDGVGATGSMKEGSAHGWRVIDNMRRFRFSGRIYHISRCQGKVHEMRAYPTVSDAGDPTDLAIIITPPETVTALVDECVMKGIRAGIVVSEGFAETGPDGAQPQQRAGNLACTPGPHASSLF